MKQKRILALLLTLVMTFSLLPSFSVAVSAAEGETAKNITLGTAALKGAQQSNIWFGNYQQSSLGNTEPTEGIEGVDWIFNVSNNNGYEGPYYKIEPIKWRVLSNTDGKVFLLSDQNIDTFRYHTDQEDITWEKSTIRSWLNGYKANENKGDNAGTDTEAAKADVGIDYSKENFIDFAFSSDEKKAITTTTVINETYDGTSGTMPNPGYKTVGGNNTADRMFLLSIAEVNNVAFGFTDNNKRASTNTAYVAGGGGMNASWVSTVGETCDWWLRSPGGVGYVAACIASDYSYSGSVAGDVDYEGQIVWDYNTTVRPAFNLNQSSVLFTSSPTEKKTDNIGTLLKNSEYTQNDFKLTIKDSERNFNITDKTAKSTVLGAKLSFDYTGAKTGVNEYISAMITDKDGKEVLYYGQLANVNESGKASGNVEFKIPTDIPAGEYKVKLFNEQINGDKKTDFASAFADIDVDIDIALEGEGTETKPYLISNLAELEYFRDKVNSGETYEGKYVKLTDNIDMSGKYGEDKKSWTPIGYRANDTSLAKQFKGTFDGNGKKISGLYIDASVSVQGLFGAVVSGTVKNLTVSGAIKSSNGIVGGVIGYLKDGNAESCISECILNGTVDSRGSFGGIVGQTAGASFVKRCQNNGNVSAGSTAGGIVGYATNKTVVENSYNTGNISAKIRNAGGIIGGYSASGNDDTAKVENCYNIGTISAAEFAGAITGENNVVVNGGFYLENCNAEGTTFANTKGTAKTANEFASGEVAALLQGEQSEQVWGQTLSGTKDGYPVLTSDIVKKVYVIYTDCGKKTLSEYSNVDTNTSHKFENGVCNNVSGEVHYQPAVLEDGVYKISNGGQLVWFARLVNGTLEGISQNQGANAKLTADIDMSGIESYVPIGGTTGLYYSEEGDDKGYSGTFDGCGNVIKNLSVTGVSGTELTYGVFGTLSGKVKNLGVENFKFTLNSARDCRTGAVVGQILSDGSVENCYAANVNIEATSKVAGGIAGCNYSGTITNCFAYKVSVTASRAGGIAGDNRGDIDENDRLGTITICYTDYGNINYNQNNGNNENCETNVLLSDFASGRIAYLLNGGSKDGIWKQNLGENKDLYPNFKGAAVYQASGCMAYTNTEPSEEKEHNYQGGVCADCGDYTGAEATLKDGVYEIANLGQLLWFADKVKYEDNTICGKLVENIDATLAKRIVIGTETKPYKGTFDGNEKTISNLSAVVTENNFGLFGYAEGATVKNLTVKGEYVISAAGSAVSDLIERVGGVVGFAKEQTVIENVTSCVNINDNGKIANDENRQIGGVVGYLDNSTVKKCEYNGAVTMQLARATAGIAGLVRYNGTVSECINNGTINCIGETHHIGGIIGSAQDTADITKCINKGNVTSGGSDCIGGIVGYANAGIKIENCGNIGTITSTVNRHGFVGGILGYINNGRFGGIYNCYNYGSIVTKEGCGDNAGAILGRNLNSGDVYSNNYYLDTSFSSACGVAADIKPITATAKEKTSFENGEVAYLLGSAWGQDLEKNDYPVPGGKKVYLYANTYSNEEPSFKIWEVKSESNKMKATISAPKAGTYKVVFADYKDGILNVCEIVDAVIKDGEYSVSVTSTKDMKLENGGKVMLWSDLLGLTPLCEAFEVK